MTNPIPYRTPKDPNSNAGKRRQAYYEKGPQVLYEERFINRAMNAGFTESQAHFLLANKNNT